MSNDDVPEDGEVRSFRTRRRTRRGKRRSLRVPVDEVPRRSAADDVSSDLPPAITHPTADIESEVTQPGSVPAPMMESVETEIEAELDGSFESEIEAELASEIPTEEEEREASPAPASGMPSSPPSSPPKSEHPSARPSARPSTPASSAHPSARPPSVRASMPEGSPSRPYVPPPPGVPRDLAVPAPAEAKPAPDAKPAPEPAEPAPAPRSQPAPRRDSVVVRGTVRVSDLPEKRRVPVPASDAPEPTPEPAEEETKSPFEEAITGVIEAREELEELDASELEALESVRPEPIEPDAGRTPRSDADEGPSTDELLQIEEAVEETELPGEATAVVEAPSEEIAEQRAATPRVGAQFDNDDDSTEIRIEDASDEEIEAFGIAAEELELEIDEEEPAAEEEEEELELSEEAAIEEEPQKPVSHPPPTPAEPAHTPAAAQAQPSEAAKEPEPAPEPAAEPRPRRRRKPWWEDFFNDDYLRTVRPYPLKYVRRQCDFIESQLGLERGATILDVGCGLGLQAVELASRGYLVVGLDLSLPMLSRAADEAQDRGLKINFLHGDMREMTFDGAFDAVLCWGTTLGYFDEETNRKVIERLYRALKPMGLLLIDAVNRDHVIRHQPNLVWFEGDGCVCMEETQFNYITSRLEVKRTVILDDGRQRENVYSIRLYSLNEIGQLLHHQGFRVAQVSGHEAHAGVFFGADSPRLIIMAERRLAKGSRETPKEGSARGEQRPPSAEAQSDDESEEIDELEIEPEPENEPESN